MNWRITLRTMLVGRSTSGGRLGQGSKRIAAGLQTIGQLRDRVRQAASVGPAGKQELSVGNPGREQRQSFGTFAKRDARTAEHVCRRPAVARHHDTQVGCASLLLPLHVANRDVVRAQGALEPGERPARRIGCHDRVRRIDDQGDSARRSHRRPEPWQKRRGPSNQPGAQKFPAVHGRQPPAPTDAIKAVDLAKRAIVAFTLAVACASPFLQAPAPDLNITRVLKRGGLSSGVRPRRFDPAVPQVSC